MKSYFSLMRLSALALLAGSLVTFAADAPKVAQPVKPPSETALRAAITKSLGFLAREGDTWIADRNCNSCHHLPELLWSHREARARGFVIDEKKFDEWQAWAAERAADKKPGLEEASLMILALPERPALDLVKLLAGEQKPDGTWKPAGQYAEMQKRGLPDAQSNAVRLNLLALTTMPSASAERDAAKAKAAAILQKKDEPPSLESLVFRILYARSAGDPNEAKALSERIVKLQRRDGGWSSIVGENMSDPLATGQALYVLQAASSDPKTADAIARAQHWLIKTQRDDGSWPIDYTHISRIDRSDEERAKSRKDVTMIYTYWGSSWATIGLLQSVPLK